MLIPLGQVSLYMALLLAALSVAALTLGALRRDLLAARAGRDALVGATLATWTALGVLLAGLVSGDFRIAYVASYTETGLPLAYRISALWAGADGSLLFWTALAAAAALGLVAVGPLDRWRSAAGAVVAAVLVLLLLVLNVDRAAVLAGRWPLAATPFTPVDFIPPNGAGLRLQLQTWAMIAHPPALFVAYAVLGLVFAAAVASLATGRLTAHLLLLRRCLLVAWIFLTAGNALGAWWAYTELGWGGYWSWDPVENASLIPWLVTTAALHTLAVTRRTGRLATTTLSLCVVAFLSCILATYITRSGVVGSVHAYAAGDAPVGSLVAHLLTHGYALFAAAAALVTFVFACRLKPLRGGPPPHDRPTSPIIVGAMVFVATVLATLAAGVLCGTLLPPVLSRWAGWQYVVEPEQFDRLAAVFGLLILADLAFCTPAVLGRFGGKAFRPGTGRLRVATAQLVAAAAAIACTVPFVRLLGVWLIPLAALAVAALVGQAATVRPALRSIRCGAAWLAHLAFIILAVAIAGSRLVEDTRSFRLAPGDTAELAGYHLRLEGIDRQTDPDARHLEVAARLAVSRNGETIATMRPAIRLDTQTDERQAEVALRSRWIEDLYVSLAAYDPDSNLTQVSVRRTALVMWIWIASALLCAAGLLALCSAERQAEKKP